MVVNNDVGKGELTTQGGLMAYFLEVGTAVVHASDRCQELPTQNVVLKRLPSGRSLSDALKLASAQINKRGSAAPTSINACETCN